MDPGPRNVRGQLRGGDNHDKHNDDDNDDHYKAMRVFECSFSYTSFAYSSLEEPPYYPWPQPDVCEPLTDPFGKWKCTENAAEGSSCKVKCKPGYKPVNGRRRKCKCKVYKGNAFGLIVDTLDQKLKRRRQSKWSRVETHQVPVVGEAAAIL